MNSTEMINKAYNFIKLHKNDTDEKQQAQMWIRDFLEIFNIPAQKINIGFEWRINIDGSQKYADHLLNGLLLIEMKSRNKKLDKAKSQAYRYVMNLEKEDIPKFVILSNFERIQILDLLDPDNSYDIRVEDLHKHLNKFNFLLNKVKDVHVPNNPVNEKAAKLMETLHNNILDLKYPKNASDLLMTRIVFCLFAEDSGIFNPNQFKNYILNETKEDGSDLVDKLATLFQTLNTSVSERFQSGVLDEFPYINGGLFEIYQPTGLALNTSVRNNLIKTADLDWSKISPVIFGAMFEGAMDKERRHSLGAHYTSEINIMKVVNDLFLSDLRTELDSILLLKNNSQRIERLENFHNKLATLKFLDPACGSGNFLMVAYRELRRLEHEVIDEIHQGQTILFDTSDYIKVEINQFYGIEIVPYAVSIAKIGLWMMDHLMNKEASDLFGRLYLRLPLHASANIYVGDALSLDWEDVIKANELNYILGNPPFIGARVMSKEQKNLFIEVMPMKNAGNLDFVSAWHYKSALMMQENPNIISALVSTNSIFQGEQANILWNALFNLDVKINFAHQTFKWDNNGAVVHVCICGFSKVSKKQKLIYVYEDEKNISNVIEAKHINEYLVDAPIANIQKQSKQISGYPKMEFGSMANDNGNLILNEVEKASLLKENMDIAQYIYLYLGSKEYLRNEKRYILYLKNAPVKMIKNNKELVTRINNVRDYRLNSSRKKTNELGNTPLLLAEDRVSFTKKLLIPRVSSSRRPYIPIGFVDENTIVSDSAFQLVGADLYLFGILQSKLHTLWIKTVAGRLKSDVRYSNTLVYNTFPIPHAKEDLKIKITECANTILNIREKYNNNDDSISEIYDELMMPTELLKEHHKLDKLVEKIYSEKTFNDDNERIACLINLYHSSKS